LARLIWAFLLAELQYSTLKIA